MVRILLLSLLTFSLVSKIYSQAPQLPVDFETPGLTYFTDFGDAISQTGTDPVDPLNTVAITVKPVTAPTWCGTTIGPENGFDDPIPITADATTMSVRVYSPHAGIQVRFKIEDSTDPTKSVETEATVTMVNTWETLVFDFANEAPGTAALNLDYTFDKASIFFNFGIDGATAGEKTYYWDDVQMGGESTSLAQLTLPVTFEDEEVYYALTDFGGNFSSVTEDPVDMLNHVAMSTKPIGAETWAGTTAGTPAGFAEIIPITANDTKMSVRIYSPEANLPIRLKIEESGDPTHSVETETLSTVANTWETLEFDFSNEAPGTAALNLDYNYNKASLFFNFGTDGNTAGSLTFYWDDMQMVVAESVNQLTENPITLYPNPAKERVYIQSAIPVSVKVYDLLGNDLGLSPEDNAFINIESLPAGCYYFHIQLNQQLIVKRIVKY